MVGIKDQRTAGDNPHHVNRVDETRPYFVIVFPEGDTRKMHPLSNDPIEAKDMLKMAIKDGLFVEESTESIYWVNISNKDYAYIAKINPGE